MTASRRLSAVQTSLGPTQLVLQILAEARTFDSLEAYARSIVDQPEAAAPVSRIAAGAEASVRAAMKGANREHVDAAARRAVGDGVFAFLLVLHLNGAALDIARVEGLRAATAVYWMRSMLGGPREKDLEPQERAGHEEELAGAWDSWRQVVAGLQATRTVEEDAREQLEARYLGGQPSLLAEADAEWSTFADMVDRMGSLAEDLVPLRRPEERRSSRHRGQLDDRVRERARKLADDARISTLARLGDYSRALAILERRLGTQAK